MRSLLHVSRFALFAVSLAACLPAQVTQREVLSVTGGGLGESWLVVEETSGRTDNNFPDTNH